MIAYHMVQRLGIAHGMENEHSMETKKDILARAMVREAAANGFSQRFDALNEAFSHPDRQRLIASLNTSQKFERENTSQEKEHHG
jgi:hypothetical protein